MFSEEKALQLYDLGYGKDSIANALGCTSAVIRAILIKNNRSRTHSEAVALRKKNNIFSHHGSLNKKTAWDYKV